MSCCKRMGERGGDVCERERNDRESHKNTIGSMNSAYKYYQLKITVLKYYVLESTVYLNNLIKQFS